MEEYQEWSHNSWEDFLEEETLEISVTIESVMWLEGRTVGQLLSILCKIQEFRFNLVVKIGISEYLGALG